MILSIVTVVKDDVSGLIETGSSLQKYLEQNDCVEWVVKISSESARYEEHVKAAKDYGAKTIISGQDDGIFDAMRDGLAHCIGEFVLFINAKDRMLVEFDPNLIKQNSYVEVQYIDFWGRLREVPKSNLVDQGIPYCHQGLILERKRIKFDDRDRFGADYSCFLEFADEWPFPKVSNGVIWFDSTGVSTNNRKISDFYTANIIKRNFGFRKYLNFKLRSFMRLFLKKKLSKIYKPYVKNGKVK